MTLFTRLLTCLGCGERDAMRDAMRDAGCGGVYMKWDDASATLVARRSLLVAGWFRRVSFVVSSHFWRRRCCNEVPSRAASLSVALG